MARNTSQVPFFTKVKEVVFSAPALPSSLLMGFYIAAGIVTAILNPRTMGEPNIITLEAMVLIVLISPISYSVYSFVIYKREATVKNLIKMLKIFGFFTVELFLLYILISILIAVVMIVSSIANNVPFNYLANPLTHFIIYTFATILSMATFSWLITVFLYIIFDNYKLVASAIVAAISSGFIIIYYQTNLTSVLNFILIMIGIFITSVPSASVLIDKIRGSGNRLFSHYLLASETQLSLSFVILLAMYIITPPYGGLVRGSALTIIVLVGLFIGFMFLANGLGYFIYSLATTLGESERGLTNNSRER